MGGKKKKSLANKLSKMSDEERARYLQHRAEIEEEAKRRKEQLIATFMKKKIKKEDAFARLNVSKINQNWHQILRKMKVTEMKEEVDHLKTWIDKVIDYKNRRISKLIDELEQAEEQYLNSFKSHSIHMDNIMEKQDEYINKMQTQYQKELDDLLDQAKHEETSIVQQANSEMEYLKTVTYGQKTKAEKHLRKGWEYYTIQLYEIEHENRMKLRHLHTTRGETEFALWRQILQIVRMYVQKTDTRRSHLQELKRMDSESVAEIGANEEKIKKEEVVIDVLKSNYECLMKSRSVKITALEKEERRLNNEFIKIRKTLKNSLSLDEKQLRILTSISNESLDSLSKLLNKGNQLIMLSKTCQKYETEREKVIRWLPIKQIEVYKDDEDITRSDETTEEKDKIMSGLTDDEKIFEKALNKEFNSAHISKEFDDLSAEKSRPKTSFISRFPKSAIANIENTESLSTPIETAYTSIEKVEMGTKNSDDYFETEECLSPGIVTETNPIDEKSFLNRCYESLEKMENFWGTFNKAGVDVLELKNEKSVLEKENKQLRGLIRAVLEAAALAKSIPDSRVSTRVASKRRSAYSAPLQRIVFN